MNYTDEFLNSIDLLSKKSIDKKIIKKIKILLIDYLGNTIAGSYINKEKCNKILINSVNINGNSPLIGLQRNVNIENAILINGLNSHVLDFDDGTNRGIIHLGAPIFTVLLPLLKNKKIHIVDFYKSVVLGYEVSYTLAASIQPEHKMCGYHATGTCGTIGAAMAIAYLLNYDKEEKKNAFSASVLSSSGSLKALEDGSDLKPYNVAKAALNAYVSSLIAIAGFKGPNDVLSGDRGFFEQFTRKNDIVLLEPLYLNTYAIEKAYINLYASWRYFHPAIDAIINIKKKYNLKSSDIEKIEIYTYKLAVKNHNHIDIQGVTSAKMSIPYSVAVAFIFGTVGLSEFNPIVIKNSEINNLASKVLVIDDDNLTKEFPTMTPAICKVYTVDNNVYSCRVDIPKGEPENPLSIDEVINKFLMLTDYSKVSRKISKEVIEIVNNLDYRYNELFDILGGDKVE